MPGPPGELRRLWPAAVASEPVQAVLARTTPPGRRVLRFYGAASRRSRVRSRRPAGTATASRRRSARATSRSTSTSSSSPGAEAACRRARGRLPRPARAVPLHRGRADRRGDRPRPLPRARAAARDGRVVHRRARRRRLTDVPGRATSSRARSSPTRTRSRCGELGVRRCPARGARRRVGRGRGGDGDGRAGAARRRRRRRGHRRRRARTAARTEKPVGLVYFHVSTPDGERGGEFSLPADRETVRSRATVAALHLARRVLTQSRHEDV